MFGTYRTLLAIAVVADHFMGLGISSSPAVFGFFCLSGFLMTLLMCGPYEGRTGAFFLNRFLRIYPVYWATALLFAGIPTADFLRQALLIVRVGDPPLSIAWAVTNELVFYILIGFGASKTLRRSIVWLVVSVVITVVMYFGSAKQDLASLYFPVLAGSLPFAAGAVLFHLRDRVSVPSSMGALAALGIVLTMILAGRFFFVLHRIDLMMLCVYASLPLHAAVIATLYRLTRWRVADDLIGRLSYPVYMMQTLAFQIAATAGMPTDATPSSGLLVLLITLALAIAAAVVIDAPVQWLREYIKIKRWSRPRRHSQGSRGLWFVDCSD